MLGLGIKTIGLALDQTGARLIKLKKKKSWEIESASFLPLPAGLFQDDQIVDSAELRPLLAQWVKTERLQGAKVTLAFPAAQVIIRRLRIQSTNIKELHYLVALEVETTLHLPFEDPVHDYVTIDQDEQSTQVLVFAASRLLIQSYVDLLQDVGLRVGGIELSATALSRAIRQHSEETFQETMLINLDANALEIYMFHNGYPVFSRTINLYADNERSGALSSNQLSEVTAEIARMLNFYQFSIHEGTARITEALIVGSDAGRQQLFTELKQTQPDMSIRAIPFNVFAQKPDEDGDANRVSIGLALWPLDKNRINLMPRIDREAKLFPVVIGGAALLWLLAAVAVGYFYADSKSELSSRQLRVQQLNDQLVQLESSLVAKNSGTSGQVNPTEIIEKIKASRRDAVAVIKELTAKLPEESLLQTLSYNSTGQLGLTVQVNDWNDASRYLYDLRGMSFSTGAILQSVTDNRTADGNGNSGSVSTGPSKTALYTLSLKGPKGGDSSNADHASDAQ